MATCGEGALAGERLRVPAGGPARLALDGKLSRPVLPASLNRMTREPVLGSLSGTKFEIALLLTDIVIIKFQIQLLKITHVNTRKSIHIKLI